MPGSDGVPFFDDDLHGAGWENIECLESRVKVAQVDTVQCLPLGGFGVEFRVFTWTWGRKVALRLSLR